MGDFNIAQFIGGIVEGMGKGLTSDKGGGAMNMEVIPKKKNAPPVIEMTPSQTAASDVVKGAGTVVAMGQPMLSPSTPVAPQNRRQQTNVVSDAEFDDTSTDPPKYDWSGTPIAYGHDLPGEGGWSGRGGRMRQMRTGGVTDPQEPVIVHEGEKVQGLPNGQVIVTPQEEVVDADVTADRPPAMSLPDTVQQGPNDEGYLQNELLKNMEVKSSPWKDFGAALIQAGNNHFNNKNEPIRTWGEIQRDKRVAPLAAKLALVRDAKKTRQEAEEKAARIGLVNEQTKTIGRDDALNVEKETRLKTKDENNVKMWERKLDQADVKLAQGSLKLAQDAELIKLRDKWALADDEISKRRLALVEQEMTNRMTRHGETLEFNKQKQAQLQTYRGAALKIAGARKGSDGSPQSATKIAAAETALRKSVAKAVKDGVMDEEEAQDILSEGIPGYLKGGVTPIDE